MTGTIMPTAAPATPAAASPTSAADAVDVDRRAPFGPALARAREQVPRDPGDGRSGPADDPAEPTNGDDERAPSSTTGNDESNQGPPPADRQSANAAAPNAAAPNAAASNAAAANVAASGAGPSSAAASIAASSSADATVTAPPTEISETNAATSISTSSAASDHPTAKGSVGDGGPSTSPTVEGAAPPSKTEPTSAATDAIPAEPVTAASANSISQDGDGVVTPATDSAGAGHTSANEAASGNRQRPIDTRAATAATVDRTGGEVGPSITTATEPADMQTLAATTAGPHRTARVELDSTTATTSAAHGLAAAENAPPLSTEVASPVSTPDEGSPSPTSTPPAAADGAEGLVMPARETGQSSEAARPIATASPTPGPLEAEGSLWDDVRMAFDRIRKTGDGQEVRIRLRPAELGELVVQVRTQGEQIAVRLTASSPAAQQALIDDRLRLAAELARAGFEEGSVDIGRDDGGGLGHPRQDTDDERGRGRMIPERLAGVVERSAIERRDPIRTESGVRPGRHAYSTINLTL